MNVEIAQRLAELRRAKGVLKKNTASRKISRMAKRANKAV